MEGRCAIARCRAQGTLTYLGREICDRHWDRLTAEGAPPDALRRALGIDEADPSAMEDRSMEPTSDKTPKKETPVKADAPAKAKKAKKAKAVKEPAPKEAEPKKEKMPKEPQVVFAFRLTEAQRDAIHKAAGPGKATKFVLSAALAAASGNRPAFEELLKSCQK